MMSTTHQYFSSPMLFPGLVVIVEKVDVVDLLVAIIILVVVVIVLVVVVVVWVVEGLVLMIVLLLLVVLSEEGGMSKFKLCARVNEEQKSRTR